jgi:hypothetical protein
LQSYVVTLTSEIPTSFRTQKAADSVNLRIAEKSKHELKVAADLKTPYSVGLIVGNSGSRNLNLVGYDHGLADLDAVASLGRDELALLQLRRSLHLSNRDDLAAHVDVAPVVEKELAQLRCIGKEPIIKRSILAVLGRLGAVEDLVEKEFGRRQDE